MAPINPLQSPIDYSLDVKSPFEAIIEGMNLGAAIGKIKSEQESEAYKIDSEKAAQQEISNLFANPMATAADYARVSAFLPKEHSDNIRKSFDMLNSEQQQNSIKTAAQIYSSLKSGQIEIAKDLLKEQVIAQRNSGREEDAKAYETSIKLIDINPSSAQTIVGIMTASLPGGKELLENVDRILGTINEEEKRPYDLSKLKSEAIIKKQEADFAPEKLLKDLELTKEQIAQAKSASANLRASASKSNAEARIVEAESRQILSGIIPYEKRPEMETKFRKEYSDQTKTYQDVKSAYATLLASQDTAVGDLSLIFGYMKMIDPGSVVREGEFANAQNTAGVPERVMNIYNKVASGERLTPEQRSAFKGQAKGIYNSSLKSEELVRSGLDRIAKGYGLNTDNIFYSQTESQPGGQQPQQKTSSTVSVNGKVYTRPESFSDEQWHQYNRFLGVK